MTVSVVTQRFRGCRILLEELHWISVGCSKNDDAGNSSSHCGLLVYVSFASGTTSSQVYQSAQTLLNLPVLTSGLWGDGESVTKSVLDMATAASSSATAPCSLVIVPQANLISKVKQMGKSIQYHGQVNKEQGRELYNYFCDCLRSKILEAQCESRGDQLPEWYMAWRSSFEQGGSNNDETKIGSGNKTASSNPSTPPNQLFRDSTKYSSWDDKGLPTTDVEGQPLTRSSLKKINKIYEAHCKKHLKWKEQHQMNGDAEINNQNLENVEPKSSPSTLTEHLEAAAPKAQWDESLDPTFCQFVAGSFGKRQGLEFHSDMGPFVHSFQV